MSSGRPGNGAIKGSSGSGMSVRRSSSGETLVGVVYDEPRVGVVDSKSRIGVVVGIGEGFRCGGVNGVLVPGIITDTGGVPFPFGFGVLFGAFPPL